jgi:hypothetical protein
MSPDCFVPNDECPEGNPQGRRAFLKKACGISAALMAGGLPASASPEAIVEEVPSSPSIPKVRMGDHLVSRLVLGANPVWGYSYQGELMSKFMVNYYNDDNIVKLFHQSERAGINTFQTNFTKRFPNVWKRYRDEGGKMNLVILYHPSEVTVKEAAKYNPIAIVHHGGVTDRYWRENRFQLVHDFVREVKDAGVLAGVSCHEPDVIDKITEDQWENDLFMACLYVMSRPEAEWKKILGFKPIQDTFYPNDPERMCQSIRKTKKPCLGFKILAGGWAAGSPEKTERAFQYAFQNIKASDGVIVGMLPAFDDQVSENAKYTIRYGSQLT